MGKKKKEEAKKPDRYQLADVSFRQHLQRGNSQLVANHLIMLLSGGIEVLSEDDRNFFQCPSVLEHCAEIWKLLSASEALGGINKEQLEQKLTALGWKI